VIDERRVQHLDAGQRGGPEEARGVHAPSRCEIAPGCQSNLVQDGRRRGGYNGGVIDKIEIAALGSPIELREFPLGRFELYRIGGREIGRAIYAPGWRWSVHVAPTAGTPLCEVEHVGLVIAGAAGVKMADGTELVMRAGDFFAIPPHHDSWVIGDAEYVSLHLLGAAHYARPG
jgi:hypothetical protein